MTEPIRKLDNKVIELISASQLLTGAWADLGPVIDVRDTETLSLWLNLDINNSTNVRVRMVGLKTADAADFYLMPIKTVNAAVVNVNQEYYELDVDADQKIVLAFSTFDLLPFVKFQVMAGVLGAPAGEIDGASLVYKERFYGPW